MLVKERIPTAVALLAVRFEDPRLRLEIKFDVKRSDRLLRGNRQRAGIADRRAASLV